MSHNTMSLTTMSPNAMRVGGGLGLASVVALLGGLTVMKPSDATLSATPEAIVDWYTTTGATSAYTGGYLQVVGLLCFLPFAACLARLLRGGESSAHFGSQTVVMGATAYVATSLAPGMAAGAAALWVAQHRPDPSTVYALNHLRTFSYQLSLMAWALFFAAVAASALAHRTLPRWLAASAGAVAVALLVGIAGAYDHWHDLASLLGLVWVVVVSVWLLRARQVRPVATDHELTSASA